MFQCLGVGGRGDNDEEDWFGTRELEEEERKSSSDDEETDEQLEEMDRDVYTFDDDEAGEDSRRHEDGSMLPLSHWEDHQLISTKCSNMGAVIEWVVVPFIVESEDVDKSSDNVDAESAEEL